MFNKNVFFWGKSTGAFFFSIIKTLENLQLPLVLFVMQTVCLVCTERLSRTWCRKSPWKISKWFTLCRTSLYCLCHNTALCPSFSCYTDSLFSYLVKIIYFSKLIILPPFPQPAKSLTLPAPLQPLTAVPVCLFHVGLQAVPDKWREKLNVQFNKWVLVYLRRKKYGNMKLEILLGIRACLLAVCSIIILQECISWFSFI